MDEAAVASKYNYRKPRKELDVHVVAYNINDLPEAILEHILSLVPIEVAVRTCVLSKKWRYLWTSYPNLELCEGHFSRKEQFVNFVDRVLLLQSSSLIKRLVLSCVVLDDASRFNLWASSAVKRNVEYFSVHVIYLRGNFILPGWLLSCATLAHMLLFIPCALKLPSRIWLPNLKVLHLMYIKFVDEQSTEQLLSSPVLEELSIARCTCDNLETLTIRAPMLKILTIGDVVSSSSVPGYSCRILICGNNLERIHWWMSTFVNDYRIEKSCSLPEAHISLLHCPPNRFTQVSYRLHKLLTTCSVEELILSSKAVEILSRLDELCSQLPIFPNLKSLNFISSDLKDLKLQTIIKLLHYVPHLGTLKLSQGIGPSHIGDEDVAIWDPAPRCFGSHLRQIKLFCSSPQQEEIRVLGLLLKHAMVLEKLIIYPVGRRSEQVEEMFRKELLKIHCGSKSLETSFSYF